MENQEYFAMLIKGVDAWNRWRKEHPNIRPDLSEFDLSGAILSRANLSGTNLSGTDLSRAKFRSANLSRANLSRAKINGADFTGAKFSEAKHNEASLSEAILSGLDLSSIDFSGAKLNGAILRGASLRNAILKGADLKGTSIEETDLQGANLSGADLSGLDLSSLDLSSANLSEAILNGANLSGANLSEKNLRGADLSGANLKDANLSGTDLSSANLASANLIRVILVNTNLTNAVLTNCLIYGISAWDVQLVGATQNNLVITLPEQPTIIIDNLKIAQFIYLLLNNNEIREVIDTIAKKAVLILGRFTPERKIVLETIRTALRTQGYLPILFDFPKPESQDLTGTVRTLANISRFIIADLTDPSCSPYEIGLIASCMKPIKPLFQPSKAALHEFAMFQDLRKRHTWVISIYRYKDQESLLASMQEKVIVPAEKKVQMLEKKNNR